MIIIVKIFLEINKYDIKLIRPLIFIKEASKFVYWYFYIELKNR